MDGNNSLKRIAKIGKRDVADRRVFTESDYYLSEDFVDKYAYKVKGKRTEEEQAEAKAKAVKAKARAKAKAKGKATATTTTTTAEADAGADAMTMAGGDGAGPGTTTAAVRRSSCSPTAISAARASCWEAMCSPCVHAISTTARAR